MTLNEILNTFKSRKNTPVYGEVTFANGKHYVMLQKASIMEVLKREFNGDEETGKTLYYNDPHDSFFLEDNAEAVEERKAA